MATRVPTVEIVIRDEVSAGVERMRQRMRAEGGREWFKGMEAGFASAGRAAQRLHNELGNLVRLTGAGAFLGGGMVAGLVKLTESLGNLSRETLQMNATAASIGLTVKQFDTLIARGQAVGLSAEQAKGQIGGLAKIIDELAVKGVKAGRFAEIYKSIGGPQFLQRVRRATLSGGTAAGIEEYIRGMSQVVDRRGRSFIADFAGMSPAWSKALQVDEKALVDSVHVSEEEAQKLNLELVKLQITLENVKKTAAVAVLPAMTELVKAFDRFVSGPGAAVVKQFGEWLASLNIDWKAVSAGVVSIIEALTKFFAGLDPIVKQIGGWKTVIGTLVGAAVLGLLVTRLGAISTGLLAIGAAAWVVPLLGMAAFGAGSTAGGAAGVQGKAGGPSGPAVRGPGGGGKPPAPQPAPAPAPAPGGAAPYGRDRRGRAYPAPQNQQRSDIDLDPENAAPYRVAGGWQPPPGYLRAGDTAELQSTVSRVTENVTRLAQNIAALGLNTDASGAGPMAGVAGRVTSGGGGGGRRTARAASSSGGPRRGGGGGGGGGGADPNVTGDALPGVSNALVAWVAKKENFSASAFSDYGQTNIGYGTSANGRTNISEPAARAEMARELQMHMAAVNRLNPDLPQGVKDALVSLSFNTGGSWYKGSSTNADGSLTLKGLIEKGDLQGAKQKFLQYNKAGGKFLQGLANRREQEANMFDDPKYLYSGKGTTAAQDYGGKQDPRANPQIAPADPQVKPANPQPNTAGSGDGPEFRTARNPEVETYVGFKRAVEGLSPEMHARVMAAYRAMPEDVRKSFVINEGWRSYEYQNYLRNIKGVRPAAPPGTSRHEGGGVFGGGIAVDIDDGPALRWLHKYGHRYGLEGILGGYRGRDKGHIQLSRSYRGQYYDPNNPQRIPTPGQAGERARLNQTMQEEFDAYLQKQKQNESERPGFASRARAGRLKLDINLRGPRGVKSAIRDSSGGVNTTINREMDPTGGGRIQSPA